jgi:outer membrane cobalamin receptor
MKQLFLFFIFITQYFIANAHQGAIAGKLMDASNNAPIENAHIYFLGTSYNTLSDANGSYYLNELPASQYTIAVSHVAYIADTQVIQIKNFETSKLNFKLKTKPTTIAEVSFNANPKYNLNIINSINLQRMPINTAQDLLKTVPGLFTAQHAGGGKAEQIFLRGFDCDHGTDIAIKVDGMPVNMVSHAHGQGYADLHFVIPEMVNKVGVQKGSYDAKSGDFSTAGAIEFTTKSRLEHNTIQLENGSFNSNRALAMLNLYNNKDKTNWIAAGEYQFTKGYFDNPMNLNRMNVFTKYSHQLSENNLLSIQATHFNSYWNQSGQIPQRLVDNNTLSAFGSVDPTEGGQTNRTNLSATLNSFSKNGTVLKNQFFYNKYYFNLYSNFTFFKNDNINGDMIQQREQRNIYGYNGSIEKAYRIKEVKLQTQAGVQLRYDDIQGSELSNVFKRNTFVKAIALGDTKQLNAAAYVDEQISFNKKWTLNTGIRFDQLLMNHDNKLINGKGPISKSIISPKASIYYHYNNKTQFYAKAGKGFHSNDARVAIAQRGQQILPASYGADLGTQIKVNKNLMLNAALWMLDLEQEFVYVGDEAVVEASGESRRLGVDFSARYQITKKLLADVDLNYAHARMKGEPQEANRIPLAPSFTSIGGLAYTAKQFNTSLRYRYLANRAANETNTLEASGYFLVDAVANYTINKFTLGISAENLLNTQWKEAQFETETKLQNEAAPVSEIHFTSGTPFNIKFKLGYNF